MSTRRRTPGIFASPTPLGPNGERLCRNCHGSMPEDKRKHNCSRKCVEEWRLKTSPHLMRRAVFQRDKGICAGCGRDTVSDYAQKFGQDLAKCRSGWKPVGRWEADHIIPIVEGGGECGLEGFRTLCLDCHHAATKELARRLSEKRAAKKLAPLEKPLIFGDVKQIEAVRFIRSRRRRP